MTFLEILLAAVLIVAIAVPVFNALRGLRMGLSRTTTRSTALLLAQAILEHVHYRLYTEAPRRAGLSSTADARQESMRLFFATLGETGARVVESSDGGVSRYFARLENLRGTGMHGITAETHPDAFPLLDGFTCEIETVTPARLDPSCTLEPELCELAVTLRWSEAGGPAEQTLTLYTIVTGR